MPVGKEVRVKNSVEALNYFESHYPKGGIVLLGSISMLGNNDEEIEILTWLYFDLNEDDPKLLASLAVFDIPMDNLNGCRVLNITPLENEIFLFYKDAAYSSVFTSTGEICIKKFRLILYEEEIRQLIKLREDKDVFDVFPVELYSHSEHKFIGVCWAVTIEDDDRLFWWSVDINKDDAISVYPVEDLSDHPINVGETAVINKKNFKLYYSEKSGYYFRMIAEQPKKDEAKISPIKLKKFNKTALQVEKNREQTTFPLGKPKR